MSGTSSDLLSLDNVRAGYGETMVLNGISLSLAPAATLAILGRNGVGKTTLLTTVVGLTTMHSGSIQLDGREIAGLPSYQRSRLGVGYVPQEREIFRSLTVEENLDIAWRPGPWTRDQVYDFFPSLAERRRNRGNELSGGEQQMLAIGRALMGNPSLLLLDEPLEGLAPIVVDAVLDGIERLRRDDALALVLVEQHARLALEFAADAIVLDRGLIVYFGPSRPLLDEPDRLAQLMGVAHAP